MKMFVVLALVALIGASVEGRAIRDLKSDLIAKGNDLVKQAEAAIVKLEAEKHTLEAGRVKTEEAHLKKLIADLEAATTDVAHLEAQLTQAEHRLQLELARATHVPVLPRDPIHILPVVTRDLKSDLIAKGNDLVKKAEEAITKLEADKKTHEVTVIKAEEARIKKAIADLTAATETLAITHLEHELQALEARLAHELTRIAHTGPVVAPPANPVTRDLKDTLIARGNTLVKQAEEAITKLEAAHHTQEAARVKTEEAQIKKLIADLTAATEATAITHIEAQLTQAEHRLQTELARVNHQPTPVILPVGPVVTRDLKSDLITKGNDLVKQAETAVAKLEADKKTHEATVIKTQEEHLKKLVADLTAATETAAITHLEQQLRGLEARLAHELTRINQTGPAPVVPANPVATRDLKSDLIARGNTLVKQAEEAITKIETAHPQEAARIKTEEAHLKKLIADLTAATETAAITRIEHELTQAEHRLATELARVNHQPGGPIIPVPANPVATRDLKSDLITKGNDLLKKADEAVTKLEADKKTHEATVIKTTEAHVKKIIADLTAATDEAKVKALEHELTQAEHRLATELTRASQPAVPVPTNP